MVQRGSVVEFEDAAWVERRQGGRRGGRAARRVGDNHVVGAGVRRLHRWDGVASPSGAQDGHAPLAPLIGGGDSAGTDRESGGCAEGDDLRHRLLSDLRRHDDRERGGVGRHVAGDVGYHHVVGGGVRRLGRRKRVTGGGGSGDSRGRLTPLVGVSDARGRHREGRRGALVNGLGNRLLGDLRRKDDGQGRRR